MLLLGLSCLLLRAFVVSGCEFTFELPDKDKQCFYEELEQGTRFEIGYQVRAAGAAGAAGAAAPWLYYNSKSCQWVISTGE